MSNLSLLPKWYIISFIFVLGLCTGSFLNVVILRGLSGENFINGRSKCPKCSNILKWYMNIPLLSYIFLKGKCAYCKEHISLQYPIVEAVCALCFLSAYFSFGLGFKTIFLWIILSLFIVMAVQDIKEMVVIDANAYACAIVCIAASFFSFFETNTLQAIMGAISAFLIFELFARTTKLIINQRAIGEGDSLIGLSLGAVFGYSPKLILCMVLAIVLQCICCIGALVKKELKNKNYILLAAYSAIIAVILIIASINYFKQNITTQLYNISYIIALLLICTSLIIAVKDIKNKYIELEDNDEENKSLEQKKPVGFHIITLILLGIGCFIGFNQYIALIPIILGILCFIYDVKTYKNNDEDDAESFEETSKVYPLGPALIVSCIICILFMDKIKYIIPKILYLFGG